MEPAVEEFILLIVKNPGNIDGIKKFYEENSTVIDQNIYYILNSFEDEFSETFSLELVSILLGVVFEKELEDLPRNITVKGPRTQEMKKYEYYINKFKNSVYEYLEGTGLIDEDSLDKLPKILQYKMIRFSILVKLMASEEPEELIKEMKSMPHPYGNFYEKYANNSRGTFDVEYIDKDGNYILNNGWIIDGKTEEFMHNDDYFPLLKDGVF